jgi:apolipoprotein N-acyltransferase
VLACGFVVRRLRLSLALVFPIVMLAIEELRGSGELGFPWFQPGYTQHAYGPVIQMASLGSVSLVTLWLLVLNVLVWRAWMTRSRTLAIACVVTLLAPWAWGIAVLRGVPQPTGPAVALVQGDIPGKIKWAGGHEKEILATFIGLSERAAADSLAPAIAIWPETATGQLSEEAARPAARGVLARGSRADPRVLGLPRLRAR